MPTPNCRRLETHFVSFACLRAVPTAGMSNPARMQIMAMTTSNSMRVKPRGEVEGSLLLPNPNEIGRRRPWRTECEWTERWGNLVIVNLVPAEVYADREVLTLECCLCV